MQLNSDSCQKKDQINADITSQCQDPDELIKQYEHQLESIYHNSIVDIIDVTDPKRIQTPFIQTVDNDGIPTFYQWEVDPKQLGKNENGMIPINYLGNKNAEMFIHEGKVFIIDTSKEYSKEYKSQDDGIVVYKDRKGEETQGEQIDSDRYLKVEDLLNDKDKMKMILEKYNLLQEESSSRDGTSVSFLPEIAAQRQHIPLFDLESESFKQKSPIQYIQDFSLLIIGFLLIVIFFGYKVNSDKQLKLDKLQQKYEEDRKEFSQTSEHSEQEQESYSGSPRRSGRSNCDKIDRKFSPPFKKDKSLRKTLNFSQGSESDFNKGYNSSNSQPLNVAPKIFDYDKKQSDSSDSPPSPDTPAVTEEKITETNMKQTINECLSPDPIQSSHVIQKQLSDHYDCDELGTNVLQKRDRFLSQNHEYHQTYFGVRQTNLGGQYTNRNASSNEAISADITDDSQYGHRKVITLDQAFIFEEKRQIIPKNNESLSQSQASQEEHSFDTQQLQIVQAPSATEITSPTNQSIFKYTLSQNDRSAHKKLAQIIGIPSEYKTEVTAEEINDNVQIKITKTLPKEMVYNNNLALVNKENSDDKFQTPRDEILIAEQRTCSPFQTGNQIQYPALKAIEDGRKAPSTIVQSASSSSQNSNRSSSNTSSSYTSSDSSSSNEGSSASNSVGENTESSVQQTDQTSSLNSGDLILSSNIKSFNNGKFDVVTPRRNKEENDQQDFQIPCDQNIKSLIESGRQLSEISDESPLQNILDTGRFKKKFKCKEKVGEGGFGQVFKAIYNVDQREYAIKVVRLHIQKSKKIDPMVEIYQHRVYRELQAASKITSENIVRYFNSWFEELEEEDKIKEYNYKLEYKKLLMKKNKNKKNPISSKLEKSNKNNTLRKSMRKFSFGKKEKKQIKATKSLYAKENQITIQEESENDDSDEGQMNNRTVMEEKKINFIQELNKKSNHTLSSSGDLALELNRKDNKRSKSHHRRKNTQLDSEKSKRSVSANMRQSQSQGHSGEYYSSSDEDQESISEFSKGSSEFSLYTINSYLDKGQEFQSVNMYIQMEYCSGQSLENFLNKRNKTAGFVMERQENLQIFTQVMHGMQDIHDNNVLHRDLKPENIFIDFQQNKVIAKIGDFGLARMLTSGRIDSTQNQMQSISTADSPSGDITSETKNKLLTGRSKFSSVAGTEVYMAPEIKHHFRQGTRPEKYIDVELNKRQDIYQLGLILYELCSKIKSFHQKVKLFKQLRDEKTLDDNCPIKKEHIEYELILKMTSEKPEDRPSAKEILKEWIPQWKTQIEQDGNQPQDEQKMN